MKTCLWTFVLLAFLTAAGLLYSEEALIFDFEGPTGKHENADKLTYVSEHATQGYKAGKAQLDRPLDLNFGWYGGSNQAGKWGEYDQFILDVFIEGSAVKCTGFVTEKGKQGWWDRYNYEFTLSPGKRRLAFSLGAFKRQRDKQPMSLKDLSFFAIRFTAADTGQKPTLHIDNGRLVKGTGNFEVKVLYSFEGNDSAEYILEDWPKEFAGKSSMQTVEENATHLATALKLESRAPAGNVQFSGFDPNWTKWDTLAIDIYNPNDNAVHITGWIKTSASTGYWDRYNYARVIKPGMNCMKITVGGITNPRNKRIDLTDIKSFNIAVDNKTLLLDNIRLIKGVEEIPVSGMRKFDFGPANSALMPGFERVHKGSAYTKTAGFGWLPRSHIGRDFDIVEKLGRDRAPDDLCRDFCQPVKASFGVDLPNGDYHVWLMLGPPGNGWGTWFDQRTVMAEGQLKAEDRYTAESFKDFEFQFEAEEDLPGDDLWEKYIAALFKAKEFDITVTDGQLTLDFAAGRSNSGWWTTHLNGMVVFPVSSKADGMRWLNGLADLRKEQYQALHVENLPPLAGVDTGLRGEDKERGYIHFIHSPDQVIQVNHRVGQGIGDPLALQASLGEYENGCIGIFPLQDCGMLQVSVNDLTGPNGAVIPASSIQIMSQVYKAINHDAIYTIEPKYLDYIPKDGITVPEKITRSIWLTVKVPNDAPGGKYTGEVKLAFSKAPAATIPLSLEVWPIKLKEPSFPMGIFMVGVQNNYTKLDSSGEMVWKDWAILLKDMKEHGMTSIDPMIRMTLKGVTDGKADIDFTAMDRFMKIARQAGFTQPLNGYGIRIEGVNLRNYELRDNEAKRHGLDNYGQLIKIVFDAIREHAAAHNWLPIVFCTDDEYIVHPGSDPAKLGALHRVLRKNAPGFDFVAFDSMRGTDAKSEAALGDIHVWGAGLHGPWDAEKVKAGGNKLWLYNTGRNRFAFGLYMFFARKRYDVAGFAQWVYPTTGTYTTHYLGSHREADYGMIYPTRKGMLPTLQWERIRAGADDHRYFETAWDLIEEAKRQGRGTAEAKALKGIIEDLFSKMRFGTKGGDAREGFRKLQNTFSGNELNKIRAQLAKGIIKLQMAMGE